MYGILTKTNSASDHEELNEYSSFTMEEINHHKIRYSFLIHDSNSVSVIVIVI